MRPRRRVERWNVRAESLRRSAPQARSSRVHSTLFAPGERLRVGVSVGDCGAGHLVRVDRPKSEGGRAWGCGLRMLVAERRRVARGVVACAR